MTRDELLAENAELKAKVERLKTQLSIVQTTQHIHDQRPLTALPNVHEIRFEKREWVR